MKRRINVRGENLSDIRDRHAQIKARLLRSIKHRIADQKFEETSYTDATMMLVETDITIQYRQQGEHRLFKSDPKYYEILWWYFSARFIDPDWIERLSNPQELFATMMSAVSTLGQIDRRELYEMIMDDDHMSYCGVKGSFQRVRVPGEERYQNCLKIDKVSSIEHLYEASIRLCCVAIDAYVVNYLSGWTDLEYGSPHSCMNHYLNRNGITKVFSLGSEQDAYEPQAPLELDRDNFLAAAREHTYSDQPPVGEFSGLIDRFYGTEETEPATIDHSDDDPNWRNAGINRMLP